MFGPSEDLVDLQSTLLPRRETLAFGETLLISWAWESDISPAQKPHHTHRLLRRKGHKNCCEMKSMKFLNHEYDGADI